MATRVEVDVLGPLRLRVDGEDVPVPGSRRRALLALLATAGGHTVSADALVEALWADDAPPSATATLQSHVSRLRRHLGEGATALVRAGSGYKLDLDDDGLDARRAGALAAAAAGQLLADPTLAAQRLREALGLWRGQALAEFGDVAPLAADATQFAELRRRLVDDLLTARLRCEPASEVVADAARAAADEPWREPTHLLLVRALAAAGRSADALAAARAFRRQLADDTGLEPSSEFRDTEQAIARGGSPEAASAGAPSAGTAPASTAPASTAPAGIAPASTEATGAVSAAGSASASSERARRPLPRPATALLGRDVDLDRLTSLVRPGRCVTVVGPGGMGKTRISLELARSSRTRWKHGVAFVELASTRDETSVSFAVAEALGVNTGSDLLRAVIDYLAAREVMIVLDNCEHLVDAARTVVAEVLRWADRSAVLATSRVPLGAPGEWVYRLGSLPLPTAGEDPATGPAVALFTERAHAARGGRTLDATTPNLVAEVCRRLDGVPLAIELAASRLAVMSLTDLANRVDAQLDLGTATATADDDRHRTLRTTINWSYQLLDPAAQRLYRFLSVFPDRIELAAAEFVAAGCGLTADPLATLGTLVQASMIDLLPADDDAPSTYRMLDSIRARGLELAVEVGELGAARRLLAAWATAFAAEAEKGLEGPDEATWSTRVAAAIPTLRAARGHLLDAGHVRAAARISISLGDFALWREHAELWSWSLELARSPQLRDTPDEAPLLVAASNAAWRSGRLDEAAVLAARAVESAQVPDALGRARSVVGTCELFAGQYDRSMDSILESVRLQSGRGSESLGTAALAATYAGQLDRAQQLADEAEQLAATMSPTIQAYAVYVQAEVAVHRHPALVDGLARRALELANASGATFVAGAALVTLASNATRIGDHPTALEYYPEVVRMWLRTASWTQQWTTLRNVAQLLAELGRSREAVLMLCAADGDTEAPAVVGLDAERLAALAHDLTTRLGADEMARLHDEARSTPRTDVVDRALVTLAELAERTSL